MLSTMAAEVVEPLLVPVADETVLQLGEASLGISNPLLEVQGRERIPSIKFEESQVAVGEEIGKLVSSVALLLLAELVRLRMRPWESWKSIPFEALQREVVVQEVAQDVIETMLEKRIDPRSILPRVVGGKRKETRNEIREERNEGNVVVALSEIDLPVQQRREEVAEETRAEKIGMPHELLGGQVESTRKKEQEERHRRHQRGREERNEGAMKTRGRNRAVDQEAEVTTIERLPQHQRVTGDGSERVTRCLCYTFPLLQICKFASSVTKNTCHE